MKVKPIIFNGPSVRAIMNGRKTQTRRVVKQRVTGPNPPDTLDFYNKGNWAGACKADGRSGNALDLCPYGQIGDLLWVREAHVLLPRTAYRMSIGTGTIAQQEHPSDGYTAAVFREGFDRSGSPRWRPSIHMPRWASRLTLRVTGVRVERLQEISQRDAVAEGCGRPLADTGMDQPDAADERTSFAILWNEINAKRGLSWQINPWVWVIAFEPIHMNIDQVEDAA